MEDVLIVIDMQNDFITGSLGSKAAQKIVPNVVKKIEEYKKDGKDVYYTRDTHFINYMETLEGKKLPVEHCIFGSNGWQICDEIKDIIYDDNKIIDKHTFGYDLWIRELTVFKKGKYNIRYNSIEIIGLCTDICVVSNALILRALFPNTKIVVDAQCCAGTTLEKHKAALDVMESCQIDVINR